MPLFGKSQKSPADLVKNLKEAIVNIEKQPKRASEMITAIKGMVYGTQDQEPQSEQVAQLAQEMYQHNCLNLLICNLSKIDFEGKKDVVLIVNNLLRRKIGTRSPTVEHIGVRPEILTLLVEGYCVSDIALNCGMMLRECIRHESLASQLLQVDYFFKFFDLVTCSTFDVASDAFSTFKELLTRHKLLSADFLDRNYETVFEKYQKLLDSDNYVTKRQALKLLGELLLDRHNFTVMTRYISNPANLKLMMNLLRDKSPNIQFEAFHVFKVFVANPNKPKPILEILVRNQEKLLIFLAKFQTDRTDDEQFNDEKAYLIKQIKDLQPPEDSLVVKEICRPQPPPVSSSLSPPRNKNSLVEGDSLMWPS